MKLKLLAASLAFGLAAHAGAATIDNGATGNGGLVFSLWDASGSYSRNLGYTIDSFESALAGAGSLNLNFAADSVLTGFLSSHTGSLNWNIYATDTSGARRILETVNPGATIAFKTNDVVRTAASQIQSLETGMNAALASVDSATYSTADAGYIGKPAGGVSTINTNIGVPTVGLGNLTNNTYGSALSLVKFNAAATGIANDTFAAYTDATPTGTPADGSVHVWFDANNALNFQVAESVAAVPEPETYAMFLAGLGLMGVIARRRRSI